MPLRTDGEEIRRRRKLKGLTIAEFAQRAGYTLNHVSQVELGHTPGGDKLHRVAAEILGCEVADLLKDERPLDAGATVG